ncbi:hypothetical protein BDN72DRAFT_741251, partial [Pluteus cervinus]
LLLWIMNSLTPQEIRDRIVRRDSEFCKQLIEYLEGVHTGDFLTGSQQEVLDIVKEKSDPKRYPNPIETLPSAPPTCMCLQNMSQHAEHCAYKTWRQQYPQMVDHIIAKSNIHKCSTNLKENGSRMKGREYKGCLDNKWGKCRARFPRDTHEKTELDYDTGSILLKKQEPMINTFTPVLSYLFRCNTDVTSLKSGTALKSVILYVTNYITKSPLKTYTIFEVIKSV